MTDTMYNHEMPPKVNHFAGTDLVVEHVEKYWCPTIVSTDLTGAKPFRFSEDKRRELVSPCVALYNDVVLIPCLFPWLHYGLARTGESFALPNGGCH